MRFFLGVCLICMVVASFGCMTNNWSSPLFKKPFQDQPNGVEKPDFFHQTFGKKSGVDPRAQDIEESLGYDY